MSYEWAKGKFMRDVMMDNKFIESVTDMMRQAEQVYKDANIPFDSEIFECSELVRVTESKKIPGYTLAEEEAAAAFIELLFMAKKMNLKLAGAVISMLKYYEKRARNKSKT